MFHGKIYPALGFLWGIINFFIILFCVKEHIYLEFICGSFIGIATIVIVYVFYIFFYS
jgi:hypothetical protein